MADFINVNVENVRVRKAYKERRAVGDRDCKVLYRFQPENILRQLRYFLDLIEETRGGALTNEKKMKIFLRYVGDPGFFVWSCRGSWSSPNNCVKRWLSSGV
jgi:hypothetical protein